MSLRERKKLKTANSILKAAASRFIDDGIDGARMEEIAGDADVSVGTLYNYFGSKQALVLAIFEADVEEMLESGGIAASDDTRPIDAVQHLFNAYLDVITGTNRDLLREVLRFSLGGGESVRRLADLDGELMIQLGGLLDAHQRAGRLAKSLVIDDAVFVLYSVLISELLMYLSLDGVTKADVQSNVARRVELVFDGMKSE